jgi:hypothetical protein
MGDETMTTRTTALVLAALLTLLTAATALADEGKEAQANGLAVACVEPSVALMNPLCGWRG